MQPMMPRNSFGANPEPEARKKVAGGATTGKRPRNTNRALKGREKRAHQTLLASLPGRILVQTVFSGGCTTGYHFANLRFDESSLTSSLVEVRR